MTSTGTSAGVVVAGVDGSVSAEHAVAWAATEAGHRGATLRLLHAYVVPEHGYPRFLATVNEVRKGLRRQGEEWLREAREVAEKAAPGVAVETASTESPAAAALLVESRRSGLVVLGSRGLGGFSGLLLGSVAIALAAHGECPVIVVRGRRPEDAPPAGGPVVVGVDGSEASAAAIEFAFTEAAQRGVPLVAVHAWSDVAVEAALLTYPMSIDPAELEAEERARLEARVADCRRRHPAVVVEQVVVRDRPVRTLLEHAKAAQLLVVGSRGRGGFTGMVLGSTSRALVMHAPCPVAVVRPHGTGGET